MKEAINEFFEFVRSNPRCKEIISPIAVVKSKGSLWEIPFYLWTSGGDWKKMNKPMLEKKEYRDYIYLNTFFPGFSDDGINCKFWWTGTPYGTVDLIYPEMKLEDMKKYNTIIFLGYNRMDSVRSDFLHDLMNYVEDGGITLLSIDQLKDCQDKLDVEKLEDFLGARVDPETKKEISGSIKVIDPTLFKIDRGKYSVSSKAEKKDWVYKVTPGKAKIVAKDSRGNPVLLYNNYGRGYVFFFTTPDLCMISPAGKSPLVSDVIEKVCRYKPLPISISPVRNDVEFLISKTEDKQATIFIMNHGEKTWKGDVIINLKEAGLSSIIGEKVVAKIGKGYDVKEITPTVTRNKDNLIISGITLSGDTDNFCSYRQVSFVYIRLGEQ